MEHLVEAAVLSELVQFSLDPIQPRRPAVQVVFAFEVVPLIVVFDWAGSMVCVYHLFDWKMFDLRHLHYSRLNFVAATTAAAAVVIVVAVARIPNLLFKKSKHRMVLLNYLLLLLLLLLRSIL